MDHYYGGKKLMYSSEWVIQAIIRLISAIIVIAVVKKSLSVYLIRGKKSISMKYLIISFIANAIANGVACIIAIINVFTDNPMDFLARLMLITINICNLIAADYSVHFVARAFYAKHSPFILSLYDVAVAILIGMTLIDGLRMASFSLKENIDAIVLIIQAILIMLISITVMKYSFTSAKAQNDILLKRSMQMYGIGITIFMISMVIIVTITAVILPMNLPPTSPVEILLNSMTYMVTPIDVYFMYVSCFHPKWFVNRYQSWWVSNEINRRMSSS